MSSTTSLKDNGACALVMLSFLIVFYFIGFYFEKTVQNVGGGLILAWSAILGLIITIIYSASLMVSYFIETRKTHGKDAD